MSDVPDGRRRSREGWADAMEAGPPAAPEHTHRLPPVVRIAVVGLTFAVFLALVGVGLLATYVYQQQQYIQGKGEQRDQENVRLHEQIRQAMCDLLDQLPEGGLLDRPRDQYGCGPGIPIENLTPEEQAQVAGRVPSTVQPPAAVQPPSPGLGSPAVPDPPRPPANTPTPSSPEPTPEPAPGPLDPITEPACDLLGVCL